MGANQFLKYAAGILASLVLSIASFVCAMFLSVEVAEKTKGRNFSDVGIPMYTHGVRAFALGLLTYFSMIIFVFLVIRWNWKFREFVYIYFVINFFALMMVLFVFMMAFS